MSHTDLLSSRPRSWSRVHSSSFFESFGLGLVSQRLGLGLGHGLQGLGLIGHGLGDKCLDNITGHIIIIIIVRFISDIAYICETYL